ncbi:Aste57867_699 [Aphanomyces stellatus]|uniref:Aste57867_699 protein n=1 Tax=Aphanomyces stellatus TaxID=120398 RepID=A0A485K3M6_9STRA|nr:hypothetical protein As57867_000698 [Aphanomyces stellatus]VFT77923.1 Aste57867_699 [Aphanomyces stellatus]
MSATATKLPAAATPAPTPVDVDTPPSPSSFQSVLLRSHRFAIYEYECLIQCFRIPAAPSTNTCLAVFYFLGLVVCFGAHAHVLERLTIDGNGPNEFILMFICCVIYAILSYVGKVLARELVDTAPWYVFALLSFTTFSSTFLSTYSLRYISFIVRVLGKTCKPVPIMAIGLLLGKRYPLRKYVSVVLVTVGAILFFVYQSKKHVPHHGTDGQVHPAAPSYAAFGALLVMASLFFDGATGALEEKFMTEYQMGPFTMMHKINVISAALAVMLIVATSQGASLVHVVENLTVSRDLLLLGLFGGFGQMFIFLMISRFGALMTSVAGTARKILTICLSIAYFGHVLTAMQYAGLAIAVSGMCVNLLRGSSQSSKPPATSTQEENDDEATALLTDEEEIYERELPDDEPSSTARTVFPDVRGSHVPKPDEYGMAIDIAFRATTAV